MVEHLLKYLDGSIKKIFSHFEDEVIQIIKNEIYEYEKREVEHILTTKTFLERDTPVNFVDVYFSLTIKKKKGFLSQIILPHDNKLSQFSIIQGNAGCGKSMFAKNLFLEILRETDKIPVLIELRYLKERKLLDVILETFLFNKIATSENISERLLKSGKITFILDGFDEVAISFREDLLKEINSISKRYDKLHIRITSRAEVNLDSLNSYNTFEIQELSTDDIETYIKKQLYNSTEIDMQDIIYNVRNCNPNFREYFRNPLFLSMYILTFKNFSEVPDSKYLFYEQLFDTLYFRHDKVNKLSFNRSKITSLKKNNFDEILCYMSYLSFKNSTFSFKMKDVDFYLNQCKKFIKNIPTFDNEEVIEDLVVTINILYKEGYIYNFPHRSLQEYFSARFTSNLSEDNKKIVYKQILENILHNSYNLNHLSLLYEMDSLGFKKHLIIPLIEQILELEYSPAPYNVITETRLNFVNLIQNEFNFISPKIRVTDNRLDIKDSITKLRQNLELQIENERKSL